MPSRPAAEKQVEPGSPGHSTTEVARLPQPQPLTPMVYSAR